ncbi:hypothetical protein MXB_3808 [Myxobolus squamalis]|nr:hypothetical protein MXB_3808 [Myxobolus squamalis]
MQFDGVFWLDIRGRTKAILKPIIVTSINSLQIPIQSDLYAWLGLKRNLMYFKFDSTSFKKPTIPNEYKKY